MKAKTTLRVPDFMKPILEDIRNLRSDGHNPNRMTNKQKEELWKSLEEFGWTDPILTDNDGVYADVGSGFLFVWLMESFGRLCFMNVS